MNKIIKRIIFLLILVLSLKIDVVSAIVKVDCGNITDIPRKVPEITSFIITIVQIVVPVILVIVGSIDLFKGMASQKEDEMQKGKKILIKRLITATLVFSIIMISRVIVSAVASSTDKANIISCMDCFLSRNCLNDRVEDSNGQVIVSAPVLNFLDNMFSTFRRIMIPFSGSSNSNNNNSNNNSNSNSNNNNTSTIVYNGNILLGDSRTVGICTTYTNDYDGCQYSIGSGKQNNKDFYIGEIGEGYTWFMSTGLPATKNKAKTGNYNIIVMLGGNDCVTSSSASIAEKYFDEISSLAKNEWKNHNIVFVSVNPFVETSFHNAKQAYADSFNAKIKSKIASANISNLSYCDTASSLNIVLDVNTSDGAHYNSDTYKTIYNKIFTDCVR